MNERERLERVISDALTESLRDGRPVVACLADAVEEALKPAPIESPVWPGLGQKGLERAAEAYRTAYTTAIEPGPYNDARLRAGYTAEAAYLWRAMVASLPRNGWGWVLVRGKYAVDPDALAALADPYDGGGK